MRLSNMLLLTFVLSVALVLAGYPHAAMAIESPDVTRDIRMNIPQQAIEIPNVIRGTNLLNFEIRNPDGDSLGSVEDVLVTLENGRVRHIVASFGGFLGIGDKLFAVPWEALELDEDEGALILNVEPAAVENAPSFTAKAWPTMTQVQWDRDILSYWETVGVNVQYETNVTTERLTKPYVETASDEGVDILLPQDCRLSEMLGYEVIDQTGMRIGRMEDVLINWERDTISYVAIMLTEPVSVLNEIFLLPCDVLVIDPANENFVLNVDVEIARQAPSIPAAEMDETITTPAWDQPVVQYWTGYGYGYGGIWGMPSLRTATDNVKRTSNLLGTEVRNQDDVLMGQVEDILFNPGRGVGVYAVLAPSDNINSEYDLLPIPMNVHTLQWEAGEELVFVLANVTEGMLNEAPGFDQGNWPDTSQGGWVDEYRQYWFMAGVWNVPTTSGWMMAPAQGAQRISQMLGNTEVETLQGDTIGTIEDFLMNPNWGVIVYPVVSTGEKLLPIPMSGLFWEPGQQVYQLRRGGQPLLDDAPGFQSGNWPDTSESGWDQNIRNYWLGVSTTY